jgi:hypothetical protein
MVVKRDTDVVLDGYVDEPKAVLLALLNRDCTVGPATVGVLVGTVDEDVVSRRSRTFVLQSLQSKRIDLECSLVVPIVDCVRTEIKIVVGRSGSIEDNSTDNTVAVLG